LSELYKPCAKSITNNPEWGKVNLSGRSKLLPQFFLNGRSKFMPKLINISNGVKCSVM